MPPEPRAHHHDIAQVFVEQHLGDFGGMRLGGDAGADLVLALGTAVQGRGIDRVPGSTQPGRHALPYPAALIGPVDQYECRHVVNSPR